MYDTLTPDNDCHTLQASLESRCKELEGLTSKRRLRLNETLQLHRFNRECDEVSKWMKEKETVALAEDTGRDLEHVEVATMMERYYSQ